MGEAKVILSELDQSNRVTGNGDVYAAICLYTPKGDATKPTLVTSTKQLYSRYIGADKFPQGCDIGLYSARKFLELGKNLWVRRYVKSDDTMAAFSLPTSVLANFKAYPNNDSPGVLQSPTDVEMAVADDFQGVTFYTINPGVWGNGIKLDIFPKMESVTADFNTEGKITGADVSKVPTTAILFSSMLTDYAATPVTVTVMTSDGDSVPCVIDDETEYEAAVSDAYLIHKVSGSNTEYTLTLDREGNIAIKPTVAAKITINARSEYSTSIDNTYRILVKDSNGNVLEAYTASNSKSVKDGYGNSLYVESVLENSAYIGAVCLEGEDENGATESKPNFIYHYRDIRFSTAKGGDSTPSDNGNKIKAVKEFSNKETYPITVLLDGGDEGSAYKKALVELAEVRKDCVAVLSTRSKDEKSQDPLGSVLHFKRSTLNVNSSYAAMFTPHIKIFDEDTGSNKEIAPDGYYAGLLAQTSENEEIWYPVAGLTRGVIDSALDVSYRFTDGERDLLCDNQINPVRFYTGQGITIWGNSTLRSIASATQDLHVRMLLVTINPAMAKALEPILFELNDEITRDQAKTIIDEYLNGIMARRGVTSKTVVCDDTNNTPHDLDNNILNVNVNIVPTGYVKEINLNVTIVSNSVTIIEGE